MTPTTETPGVGPHNVGRRPARFQVSRRAGWRKPAGGILVGRPSVFGNPFVAEDPADAVRAYRAYLTDTNDLPAGVTVRSFIPHPGHRVQVLAHLPRLRGRDLGCWCSLTDFDGVSVPCHADVLLNLANTVGEVDQWAEEQPC